MVVEHAFAAADDQVLICTAKRASKDEFALLLSHKPSDNISRFQIEELDFIVSHVDKHVSRVPADVDTRHLRCDFDLVLEHMGHIIVDCDLCLGRDCDHTLSVWRDHASLYSMIHILPAVVLLAFRSP